MFLLIINDANINPIENPNRMLKIIVIKIIYNIKVFFFRKYICQKEFVLIKMLFYLE
jgi:hypothetical protein